MVKVIKPFCLDQNFDPKALPAPALELYTCEKNIKKCVSVDIKILTPGICLPLPGDIYMWKNMKKNV